MISIATSCKERTWAQNLYPEDKKYWIGVRQGQSRMWKSASLAFFDLSSSDGLTIEITKSLFPIYLSYFIL